MNSLSVSLVQCELAWEEPADNRRQFQELIDAAPELGDIVVLPEMFTTGFSMNAIANAEAPGGATEGWLQAMATRYDCAFTGSIAVKVDDQVYNRMLFVTPESTTIYDKRHLFRMAGEHRRYAAGDKRVITNWRGWRINLQVCYDLRFPVFCRNRDDYDLMLFVANWPMPRSQHWRALLPARAIENLACVVGVNRIGHDANGLDYSGDSMAIHGNGEILCDMRDRSGIETVIFDGDLLTQYRDAFPANLDADNFMLVD